ncbi:MAG: lipocalin family protein [Rudanella sp.]|nr:lipocalin family protein [Rudanella sp.]
METIDPNALYGTWKVESIKATPPVFDGADLIAEYIDDFCANQVIFNFTNSQIIVVKYKRILCTDVLRSIENSMIFGESVKYTVSGNKITLFNLYKATTIYTASISGSKLTLATSVETKDKLGRIIKNDVLVSFTKI